MTEKASTREKCVTTVGGVPCGSLDRCVREFQCSPAVLCNTGVHIILGIIISRNYTSLSARFYFLIFILIYSLKPKLYYSFWLFVSTKKKELKYNIYKKTNYH